jgi:hypothetical protein
VGWLDVCFLGHKVFLKKRTVGTTAAAAAAGSIRQYRTAKKRRRRGEADSRVVAVTITTAVVARRCSCCYSWCWNKRSGRIVTDEQHDKSSGFEKHGEERLMTE